MILLKGAMKKAWLLFGLFILAGTLGVVGMVIHAEPVTAGNVVIAALEYAFGVLCVPLIRYSEGTGKWIRLAQKKVHKELCPEEFLQVFETLKIRTDVAVFAPKDELLRGVTQAYHVSGNDEKALETAEEMICVAPPKRKAIAQLNKVALLFGTGNVEEAETLFREVQQHPLSLVAKGLVEIILKSDRAIATGDYATAEAWLLRELAVKKPFQTPLMLLDLHADLGKVYEKTGRIEEARVQYRYCNENGGQTKYRGVHIEE